MYILNLSFVVAVPVPVVCLEPVIYIKDHITNHSKIQASMNKPASQTPADIR